MDKKKIAVLSLSSLTIITNAAIAPIMVYLRNAFPDSAIFMVRSILTLPSIVIIFSSLLAGYLSNKIPTRSLLFFGLGLYIIGGVGASISSTIYILLTFRFILGFGAGFVSTLANSLISIHYQGEERAKAMGDASVVMHVSAMIAPFIVGWLAKINWRLSFLIYLVAGVVFFITWLWLPRSNNNYSKKHTITWNLERMVYILAFNGLLLMATFYIFPTGIAQLFNFRQFGESNLVGLAVTTSTFAGTIINFFFSRLFKTFKKFIWFAILALMAIGFLIMSASQIVYLTFLGVFIQGLGMGIILPTLFYQASQYSKAENSSQAISFIVSAISLGQFLSPFYYQAAEFFTKKPSIVNDFQFAGISFGIAAIISCVIALIASNKSAKTT